MSTAVRNLRCAVAILIALAAAPLVAMETSPPNIVIIIVDDLGWKDVGYNGGEIQTPNIDQLAAKGIRLERFYSQPYCTATRSSLMTGQTPIRMGIEGPFLIAGDAHVPLNVRFLPEFLRDAGYQTALSGKWHLGHVKKQSFPMARGFDQAYGSLAGGLGYWDHTSGGGYDWHRNEVTLREEGYTTHLIADEAVRIIKQRDPDKPLFLYTAFNAPHLPNEAPQKTIDKYRHIENENRRIHAAMVDELDQGIGKIVDALEQQNILDNTLLWFLSDNGGAIEKGEMGMRNLARVIHDTLGKPAPTRLLELIRMVNMDAGSDNGPYKGGKGEVREGGILVPSAIVWPDRLPSTTLSQRITVQDILPTLLGLAGINIETQQIFDGSDRSPELRGERQSAPEDFIAANAKREAYYMNEWKLIRNKDGSDVELYNLISDPYEDQNLYAFYPDIASRLEQKLDNFPRGERVNIPDYKIFFTPESWGGEEYRSPWADSAEVF